MNNAEKLRVLENLKYAQHILHTIPEADFIEFVSGNNSRFNARIICAPFLNLLHGLNDEKLLEQEDFKQVCRYLNTDPEQSFEDLVTLIGRRSNASGTLLKLSETKRLLQSVIYLVSITDAGMPRNRIESADYHLKGLCEFLYKQGEGIALD